MSAADPVETGRDRAALIHGLAVFLLALVIVALIAAIAATQTDTSAIRDNLRSLGIPTPGAEWSDVGTLAGIGSLAAMLVGALLGGMLGARWHTKLTRRAASPNYGPDRDQPTTDDRAATTPPRRSRRPGPGRPGPVGWWRGDPDRPGPPTALTADLPQHRRSTRQSSPAAWATVSEFRVGRWPACWRSKVAPAQAG